MEKDFITEWLKYNKRSSITDCRVRIPYILNGKKHFYLPDFIIYPEDSKAIIVEIKGAHHWFFEGLESGEIITKYECAERYCKKNGMKYLFILDGKKVKKSTLLKMMY